MKSLIYMSYKLEPIFYKVVSMAIVASLIGIMILIIKQVLKKKISPKWISRIWLVFIISLIIPIGIKTNFSIYNLIPNNLENIEQTSFSKDKYYEIDEVEYFKENLIVETEIMETSSIPIEDTETLKINKDNLKYSIKEFLPILWFAIGTAMLISYILVYISFEFKLSKFTTIQDVILNDILLKAKEKIGVKKKIKLINQNIINMPSLFGVFNVRILLNKEILAKSDKEIEHIFLHELAHYKRKDNILNIIITILKCVYFWNPIIWMILNEIKKDMELGADELAILKETKEEQKEYCKTLVKISVLNPDLFLIQTMCLSENKKILERRIEMMKLSEKFKNKKGVIAIISVLIIILLIAIFYTRGNNSMTYEDMINLMNSRDKYNNVYYEVEIESNKDDNKEKIQNYWKDGILYSKSENLISYSNFNTNEYISINNANKEIKQNSDLRESEKFNNLYESELNYKDIFFDYNYLGDFEINNIKTYKVEINSKDKSEIRTFYIEKDTGFVIQFELYTKENDFKTIMKYTYKVDEVLNTDVEKPNLEDYKDYIIK